MTCVDNLFLNEYSQLNKCLNLKNTSVKTLLNDHYPNIVIKFDKC